MDNGRLKSLDALRGLNMFVLSFFHMPFVFLCTCLPFMGFMMPQLEHQPITANTLSCHDLLMPLFLFCAGTAIPFAFAKYKEQNRTTKQIYFRIFRRVAILWIMGMVCQGRLLSYNPSMFMYYSNTLQTIAVGYLFASIFFMYTKPRTQVIIAGGLLILYWAINQFVRIDGFGGGQFGGNDICEWVDRTVMGRHCDHAHLNPDGSYYFRGPGYTWILSSLNFIVTVMTGMFAGEIIKENRGDGKNKTLMLLALGAGMIVVGKLWSIQMPINKYHWTSTMTLVTSGINFILLAVIYYLTDYKKWNGLNWLIPIGMNAIFIYFLPSICASMSVTDRLLNDNVRVLFENEALFNFLRYSLHAILLYGLVYLMYKKKIFIKV